MKLFRNKKPQNKIDDFVYEEDRIYNYEKQSIINYAYKKIGKYKSPDEKKFELQKLHNEILNKFELKMNKKCTDKNENTKLYKLLDSYAENLYKISEPDHVGLLKVNVDNYLIKNNNKNLFEKSNIETQSSTGKKESQVK